jgi:hypothetical protein
VIIRTACLGEKRRNSSQHSLILRHIRLSRMNPKKVKISLGKHRGRSSARFSAMIGDVISGGRR